MTAYEEGDILPDNISISSEDKLNGSPKVGDMIAFNSDNKKDRWLISKEYFENNYKLVEKTFKYPFKEQIETLK